LRDAMFGDVRDGVMVRALGAWPGRDATVEREGATVRGVEGGFCRDATVERDGEPGRTAGNVEDRATFDAPVRGGCVMLGRLPVGRCAVEEGN